MLVNQAEADALQLEQSTKALWCADGLRMAPLSFVNGLLMAPLSFVMSASGWHVLR